MKISLFPVIGLFLFSFFVDCHYREKLRFKEGKEFTILQFTDLHYGENGVKDVNSSILQEKLINFTNPDLIIVTGDSVSGYAWDGLNSTFYHDLWHSWTRPMQKLKIPYAYTLGNHDDQADFSRKEIVDLDCSHNYSMVQMTNHTSGATNYWVPIYSSTSNYIASIMWLFDTNDESCQGMSDSWGCFENDQVKWYEEESKKINSTYGYLPKGLAWFHIPIPEYVEMHNWRRSYGHRNEGISCPRKNTELFKTMLKIQNINATFCGHDHDNDNGGFFYGIELIYGRKTGYGGYGPSYFQRGARVIKLKETFDSLTNETSFNYRHYVIQEDLSVVENSDPSWKGTYDRVNRCSR
jgi:3',5'-cyclic AMP phosphodiesterase CpdA